LYVISVDNLSFFLVSRVIIAWTKLLLPGREYLLAWAQDFSFRRKQSREHTCSRAILAWETIRLPWQDYFLAWAKHFSPQRNWTREHLSGFQVTSPGLDMHKT